MDPIVSTVNCPDCARPLVLAEFVVWGASTFKTTVCAGCASTVTYPSTADGLIDVSGPPVGRGVHGTTREERGREVLLSRPSLEQQE
jgi:ribosomal protein S27E